MLYKRCTYLLALCPADVEYAVPDHYIYPDAIIPTDPLYKDQWFYEKVKAPGAWNISTGGDVTVCIIDSGVDYK